MSAGKQAARPWNHRSTWLVIAFAILLAALVLGNRTLFAQGGGAITVTAPDPSQDPAAGPSPMPVLTAATGGVSAAVSNPPSQPGYGQTITATWMWSITSIQYAPLQSAAWGNPPAGAGCAVGLGTSTDTYSNSVNTVTGAFGAPGYWQVTVSATVTYMGPGNPQSGSASMAVVFPVFSLSITPASVYVPVGGNAPATGIVVPADLAGYFTCTTVNGNVATVTVGTPTGGNVPLTVTGVQAGTTQVQGSLGSGPPATANVTVGTFSLTPQSPAICAGGVATPIHQTLLTAVFTDSSGNPQAGQQITFSTSDGTVSPISAVTDGNGTATTTLTSSSKASDPNANPPTKYQATVTALGPSQSAQAQVEFQPPQAKLTVQPDSILPTETAALTFTLAWNQQPVSGHNVGFTITSIWDDSGNQVYSGQGTPPAEYGSIQMVSSPTDSTGTATAQYAPGPNNGTVEITATDANVLFADNAQNLQAKGNANVAPIVVESISYNFNGQMANCVSLWVPNPPLVGNVAQPIQSPEWVRSPRSTNYAAFGLGNTFNAKVSFSGPAGQTYTIQAIVASDKTLSGNKTTLKGLGNAAVTFDATGKATQMFTTVGSLNLCVDEHQINWQWQYLDPVANTIKNMGDQIWNPVFAVDGKPLPTSDNKNYTALVDLGCSVAAGQASWRGGDQVFQAIWKFVQGCKVPFTIWPVAYEKYWGDIASAPAYDWNPQENTTRSLLIDGDGKCGAWALYFSDLCRVQGIAVTRFDITPPAGYGGLAFNNLTIPPGTAQPSPPAPNAAAVYPSKVIVWNAGPPAQGQPNGPGPPAGPGQPDSNNFWIGKTFSDHALTYRDSNNNGIRDVGELIYDPANGVGGYTQLIDWKVPAIGALGTNFPAMVGAPPQQMGFWLAKPNAGALEITPPPGFNPN